MKETKDTTVGRPFDAEAARKAQAKAVESRLRNKEAKEAKEANPNGELIARIDQNVQRCVELLSELVERQRQLHPKSEDIFGGKIGG